MNRFFWLSLLILASISVAFAQDGPRVTASPLRKSLNLSDLPSAESARDNLGLPDNVEQAGSVASLGVNVFTGKQTMTQSVSKSATLWHGHFENEGTGAGSYLGVYLGTPNRYGYIRGFDYDYGTFGLADSLEFGGQTYGAVRLHQSLATGVVGIMFGNSAPYTAVATWTADGVMLNAGDIIANSVNVVDGIASAAAMATSLTSHTGASTNIHGSGADTRFLTASETILDAQIPAGVARYSTFGNAASATVGNEISASGTIGVASGAGILSAHVKIISFVTNSAEGGVATALHKLTMSKFISVTAIVKGSYPPAYTTYSGYQYDLYWDSTQIAIANHATNSENILSQSVVVAIWYVE